MAGGVPIVYRGGGSGAIASYDYFDWASGTGYKIFYAGGCKDSAGTANFLTDRQIDSSFDDGAGFQTIGTETDVENNFDLTFNQPAYISGTAVINWTMRVSGTGGADLDVTIYHVSGVTETSLGTATSFSRNHAAEKYYRECLIIPLTSKGFAVGDKLRVECKFTQGTAGQTATYWFADRYAVVESASGATVNGSFEVHIPFRIDL